MSDLVPVAEAPAYRAPAMVALQPGAPRLEDLFTFAADAELRFDSLRLRVDERTRTAGGEQLVRHEILLRHPGMARVTRRRGDDPLDGDYDIWASDGRTARTFEARDRRASERPLMAPVAGAIRPDLPGHARLRGPRTRLPGGSLADAFIHPHGLCRQVLVSGPLQLVGTTAVAGRECFLVRADHPRSTLVLTDRPDRWLEVGFDRGTGLVLLLVEHVGEQVTRHAEATSLELDPPLPDEAFRLHVSADVRHIY